MNLTQFEWIKTELKRSFYKQNKISDKSINRETYFESNRGNLRFLKEKTYSKNTSWTTSSNIENCRGSLGKLPTEGV